MKRACIFNWSGGKDSSLALYHCLQDPEIDIRYLVTSVNDSANRVSMHGVREDLLIMQAASIGIPLYQIRLPEMPGMDDYDREMRKHLLKFKEEGVTHSIFGDIFLEDLRRYREDRLNEVGLTAVFPLWKRDTTEIINEFLDLGFRTVISCTQHHLGKFSGQEITHQLIAAFPDNVDVCGENGEFHTFVFDGPIFKKPIPFQKGEKVFKEYRKPADQNGPCSADQNSSDEKMGFWYTDLIPTSI